jgi:hypothetical protein
VNIEREIT